LNNLANIPILVLLRGDPMRCRKGLILAVILLSCCVSVSAQQQVANVAHERLVYSVRNSVANDLLSSVLPVFFQSSNGQLTGTADANSNSIVLSGPPDIMAEALKIIQLLDRQPKSISIDVWIVDTRSGGWEGKASKEVDDAMSQSREKFNETLQKLHGQQRLSLINHLQLTAIENQQASVQAGERKPRVTSTNIVGGGRAAEAGGFGGGRGARTSTVVLENIGTLLQATARVQSDDQIVLQLNLEKSFAAPEESGVPTAESADGQVLARSTSTLSLSCKNSVTLANSQIVEVSSLANNSQDSGGDLRVLVSAHIRPTKAKAEN
jgi:type II secretory pathway component GspD/PulD (secretin)